jgi:hypothetical protein
LTSIELTTPTMMRPSRPFVYREVDLIPDQLDEGVLYYAPKYRTIVHLCACGCGREVPLAIGAGHFQLSVDGERPTLRPSVGNGSFPCRSHYWITDSAAVWEPGVYTDEMVARARRRDNPRAHPIQPEPPQPTSLWQHFWHFVRHFFG